MRRWASGEDAPKPGVWADLHALMSVRGQALADLQAQIARLVSMYQNYKAL